MGGAGVAGGLGVGQHVAGSALRCGKAFPGLPCPTRMSLTFTLLGS